MLVRGGMEYDVRAVVVKYAFQTLAVADRCDLDTQVKCRTVLADQLLLLLRLRRMIRMFQ